jgi:hypothetical protein
MALAYSAVLWMRRMWRATAKELGWDADGASFRSNGFVQGRRAHVSSPSSLGQPQVLLLSPPNELRMG